MPPHKLNLRVAGAATEWLELRRFRNPVVVVGLKPANGTIDASVIIDLEGSMSDQPREDLAGTQRFALSISMPSITAANPLRQLKESVRGLWWVRAVVLVPEAASDPGAWLTLEATAT